jgi:transcriptional regulator with XRE-family HTH domain
MKLTNLKILMQENGIRNTDIARDLGVSEKAVSEWINGKKFPGDSSLIYLFGKFGDLKAESDSGEKIFLKPSNPPQPPTPDELEQPPETGAEQETEASSAA